MNAELLIDHAWGWEPCEIRDIKQYKPHTNSLSSGQVLKEPYTYDKALVVALEMAEEVGLNLLKHQLLTDQVILTVGYDKVSLERGYKGEITEDFYGRSVPRHAHGTYNLEEHTYSVRLISEAVRDLFVKHVESDLLIRRINIDVNHIKTEQDIRETPRQLNLFKAIRDTTGTEEEARMGRAILAIKKRYGRNAILKGINFEEGATGRERNAQIGGHRA